MKLMTPMTVAKNWIKGGLLLVAIPCIFTTAIAVGIGLRILGIEITDKRSEKQSEVNSRT